MVFIKNTFSNTTTQDLDMGMLEDTHGSHDWHQMFSTPSDFGFCGTARDRTWVIGSHSELTQCRIDPYEVLEAIKCYFIDNEIQCRVSDYLIATEAEVRMEEMEAAQKLKLKNYIPGSSPRSLLLSHREAKVACELDEKIPSKNWAPTMYQSRFSIWSGRQC